MNTQLETDIAEYLINNKDEYILFIKDAIKPLHKSMWNSKYKEFVQEAYENEIIDFLRVDLAATKNLNMEEISLIINKNSITLWLGEEFLIYG